MKFKVLHINAMPINPRHRRAMVEEYRALTEPLLKDKPPATDQEAWKAIADESAKIEAKLMRKYPRIARWEIKSVDQLLELVSIYGTLSVTLDGNNRKTPTIYVYPTQDEENGYPESSENAPALAAVPKEEEFADESAQN